ncbi:hypothetical protein [Arcanobacterium haemolyticum]
MGIVEERRLPWPKGLGQAAKSEQAAKEILEAENVRLQEQVTKPQEGENGE